MPPNQTRTAMETKASVQTASTHRACCLQTVHNEPSLSRARSARAERTVHWPSAPASALCNVSSLDGESQHQASAGLW